MEDSFRGVINPSERGELEPAQMVIQQYARYPAALEHSLRSASSTGSARGQLTASTASPLHRKETPTPRSLQSSPQDVRSAAVPQSTARSVTSASPALLDPHRNRSMGDPTDQAESRSLPSQDLTDETIDDAYVAFILYCNPNVPGSLDTSELRKAFRSPPRSDGKSFSIFTLWELIRKLDSKELKTWIQLAIEMGVEPPSLEKKQSPQKVQQYAVRLKRWMRAMHVDAFFEYCLGHPHTYYTQLPLTGSLVSESRDGVPLEEDIALHALVPQWKPKRGRRRADDKVHDEERTSKRPQLDTSAGVLHHDAFTAHSDPIPFPQSAIPFSAFPNDMESNDPWITATSSFGAHGAPEGSITQQNQDVRWRPLDRASSPPGYPQSAIIPGEHQGARSMFGGAEPRSALIPVSGEKQRARKRHGPAVSSAWPSGGVSSGGKNRGRPPNKGPSSSDGPFSSFSVNPEESGSTHSVSHTETRASLAIGLNQTPSNSLTTNSQYQQSPTPFSHLNVRPSRLQLQVPQHAGGPVRLATPPTVLVNGVDSVSQSDTTDPRGSTAPLNDLASIASGPDLSSSLNGNGEDSEKVTIPDLIRIFSNKILRGRILGRSSPLTTEEATALAASVITSINISQLGVSLPPSANNIAVQLGLGHFLGLEGARPGSVTVKVNNSFMGHSNASQSSAKTVYTVTHEFKSVSGLRTKMTFYDVNISNAPEGLLSQTDELHDSTESIGDVLVDSEDDDDDDGSSSVVSETTWKQRFMKLRAQMHKKERSLTQYKRKVLESVMADI
ncbi:hypothetical protein ASPZODRAFT_136453 [Penicilliopsis zonata CBS 506.65]|uniref:ARS binding protein Abp2 n=1 Tax=Penicilliopsis zonata CBS 506.65 TaxID=1073090 RepID=A0A1L9S7V0_9EURO|nr:hypothetical protein ASPZODRAFT_136453 [Penicilliopsis zonata CBS 506.65]OJJ43246.1 hypothetical protein ASPZODRAFT_136453 [Penicilliopsis zonata CBS 506.65]